MAAAAIMTTTTNRRQACRQAQREGRARDKAAELDRKINRCAPPMPSGPDRMKRPPSSASFDINDAPRAAPIKLPMLRPPPSLALAPAAHDWLAWLDEASSRQTVFGVSPRGIGCADDVSCASCAWRRAGGEPGAPHVSPKLDSAHCPSFRGARPDAASDCESKTDVLLRSSFLRRIELSASSLSALFLDCISAQGRIQESKRQVASASVTTANQNPKLFAAFESHLTTLAR